VFPSVYLKSLHAKDVSFATHAHFRGGEGEGREQYKKESRHAMKIIKEGSEMPK
jgi:hypothetical protein